MREESEAPDPSCTLIRNEMGGIVAAHGDVFGVLGWTADDILGQSSSTLIHPEDQASAISAWLSMIDAPGTSVAWRGRYRSHAGMWRWVESLNTNDLDDPDEPRVTSALRAVTVDQVGIEEELRSRKQLISRLSDSLPVGLFQIDLRRHLTFTNDRLHVIIQTPAAATAEAQFAAVHPDDRERLDTALTAVLADELVDDLELRFQLEHGDRDEHETRVCLLSLRSLTDSTEVVTGAIGCVSDVTDSVRLRRELTVRANVDALTGCLNRSATLETLELALHEASTNGDGLAVIFVDLNDFKRINDEHGHATGDAVLVAASATHAVRAARRRPRRSTRRRRVPRDLPESPEPRTCSRSRAAPRCRGAGNRRSIGPHHRAPRRARPRVDRGPDLPRRARRPSRPRHVRSQASPPPPAARQPLARSVVGRCLGDGLVQRGRGRHREIVRVAVIGRGDRLIADGQRSRRQRRGAVHDGQRAEHNAIVEERDGPTCDRPGRGPRRA